MATLTLNPSFRHSLPTPATIQGWCDDLDDFLVPFTQSTGRWVVEDTMYHSLLHAQWRLQGHATVPFSLHEATLPSREVIARPLFRGEWGELTFHQGELETVRCAIPSVSDAWVAHANLTTLATPLDITVIGQWVVKTSQAPITSLIHQRDDCWFMPLTVQTTAPELPKTYDALYVWLEDLGFNSDHRCAPFLYYPTVLTDDAHLKEEFDDILEDFLDDQEILFPISAYAYLPMDCQQSEVHLIPNDQQLPECYTLTVDHVEWEQMANGIRPILVGHSVHTAFGERNRVPLESPQQLIAEHIQLNHPITFQTGRSGMTIFTTKGDYYGSLN